MFWRPYLAKLKNYTWLYTQAPFLEGNFMEYQDQTWISNMQTKAPYPLDCFSDPKKKDNFKAPVRNLVFALEWACLQLTTKIFRNVIGRKGHHQLQKNQQSAFWAWVQASVCNHSSTYHTLLIFKALLSASTMILPSKLCWRGVIISALKRGKVEARRGFQCPQLEQGLLEIQILKSLIRYGSLHSPWALNSLLSTECRNFLVNSLPNFLLVLSKNWKKHFLFQAWWKLISSSNHASLIHFQPSTCNILWLFPIAKLGLGLTEWPSFYVSRLEFAKREHGDGLGWSEHWSSLHSAGKELKAPGTSVAHTYSCYSIRLLCWRITVLGPYLFQFLQYVVCLPLLWVLDQKNSCFCQPHASLRSEVTRGTQVLIFFLCFLKVWFPFFLDSLPHYIQYSFSIASTAGQKCL